MLSRHPKNHKKIPLRKKYINVLVAFFTYLENDNGDSNSNQRNQDQCHQRSVRVHHTRVFRASSATSKEGNDQNDGSDDDQDNGSVEVLAIQKVEVLSHVKVDVGSDGDEGHTRQEEDEVDQKDNVTEHCVTTTHFVSCKVKAQIIFSFFPGIP